MLTHLHAKRVLPALFEQEPDSAVVCSDGRHSSGVHGLGDWCHHSWHQLRLALRCTRQQFVISFKFCLTALVLFSLLVRSSTMRTTRGVCANARACPHTACPYLYGVSNATAVICSLLDIDAQIAEAEKKQDTLVTPKSPVVEMTLAPVSRPTDEPSVVVFHADPARAVRRVCHSTCANAHVPRKLKTRQLSTRCHWPTLCARSRLSARPSRKGACEDGGSLHS